VSERDTDESETTDGETKPEESPSTPQETVPSEQDVAEDLPGVPEEQSSE